MFCRFSFQLHALLQRLALRFLSLCGTVALLTGCHPTPLSPAPVASAIPNVRVQLSLPATQPIFVDAAEQAGLHYRWVITGKRPLNILQSIGNGCAFLDYDGDGNLDILLVGPSLALYKGDGHGHFRDVTHAAGLDKCVGHFWGCAVGDYDNDGHDDIYLSAHRGGVLLHNEGGTSFRDVTRQAGITPQPWGSSCSFVDIDGDGKLDLYIANYIHFGPETQPQLCNNHSILTSCGPGDYSAERGVVYHNLGNGKFQDCTKAWGFDAVSGKALGVAAAPPDDSGHPVLAIANDQVPGDLLTWQNGHGSNKGVTAGMAYAANGRVYGGMGLDWGDYDNDGQLDLVIATYQNQAKCVFHNENGSFVVQDTARLGMLSSVPYVAFGVKWLDYDNDGNLDLIFANGHVQDNVTDVDMINGAGGGAIYRQPIVLYHNLQGREFEDVSARLSLAQRSLVGRGLAIGDYDNDGRMDALVVDSEGKPQLLHNVTPQTGHWLSVELEGRTTNRDGYGAVVTVEANGRRLVRHCHADGSYLSSSDKRIHFGLGNAAKIDRLQVRWPSNHTDVLQNLPINQNLRIREGSTVIRRRRQHQYSATAGTLTPVFR